MKCISLLTQTLRQGHPHEQSVKRFSQPPRFNDLTLKQDIAIMKAFQEDFVQGFLEDLGSIVEAEIAGDYMGQAEHLLAEGQTGQFDHVPAAVLSGAVLERALRILCGTHQPPISTVKPNGEPMTLNPLIVALKKAGVYNQVTASQLESWMHIRNKAAHGEFGEFSRQDVEQMIAGVKNFLANYLP